MTGAYVDKHGAMPSGRCNDCGKWTHLVDPKWQVPCCVKCLPRYYAEDRVAEIVGES